MVPAGKGGGQGANRQAWQQRPQVTWDEQCLGGTVEIKTERNGLKQGGGEKLAAPGTAALASRKSDAQGHSSSRWDGPRAGLWPLTYRASRKACLCAVEMIQGEKT